ncbi:MAG: TlpA family protein disulfide reductase [Bacteroidales bacterium]|nr:TlpA family protein disulfide reductase [Bacteroidales bacterium]
MKNRILLILAAFVSLSLNAQTLPDVKVEDPAGKAVSTRSLLDGKSPFVITFWASWCKPCQRELAAIEEAAPDWAGKYPLRIYAVSVDDSRSIAEAKALAASSEWPVTVLFDTKQALKQALKVTSIPHVFVYDKNGKLVWNHMGYIPGSEDELLQKVLETE